MVNYRPVATRYKVRLLAYEADNTWLVLLELRAMPA